jgi:tRNA (guanine37-N1)-methyltransferase
MRFDIITIFPEFIDSIKSHSIIKRAIEKNIIEINSIDFRDYALDKHKHVDDYAYGGGAGMLISVQPVHQAMQQVPNLESAYKLITSPSGTTFNQKVAERLSKLDHIVIVCGHYEGIDSRINAYIDEEISLGDYILTGGELAALTVIDSVSRLIPGVITEDSIMDESFTTGLLEYPQYTRPYEYDGKKVPDVLVSGHHANIKKWQRFESLKKTYFNRPDLLENIELSKEDLKYLEMIKNGEELILK